MPELLKATFFFILWFVLVGAGLRLVSRYALDFAGLWRDFRGKSRAVNKSNGL